MFCDLLLDPSTGTEHVINVARLGARHAITIDGTLWAPGPVEALADQLMYVVLRASLDHEADLIHLHTAFVGRRGRGVLIGGYPQSGKSTVTAQLVEQGFDYFTDERVGVSAELALTPMDKPISLVVAALAVLAHLDPARTGCGAASELLWHVPASAVRPGSVGSDATPALIVFLERRPGPALVTELHPAEMTRLLLSDAPDVDRFGARALDLVAALCASLRCVQLAAADSAGAARLIDELVDQPAPEVAHTVEPFRPAPHAQTTGVGVPGAQAVSGAVLRAAPGVEGVIVGGRCVLRAATGEIVELDETSSVWMQLFDGSAPLDELVQEVAEANELTAADVMPLARDVAARLVEAGLLR